MAENALSILNPTVLNGVLNKWVAPENMVGINLFPSESHPFPTVSYDVIKGSRTVAKYNVPNSEANIVKPLKVGKVSFSFLYAREKKVLEPTTLHWLRTPGTLAQKNAEKAVTREMLDLNMRNERLVEYSIWKALSGSLVIDTERVQASIDMGLSDTHKATADAAWNLKDTDIISDIKAWKRLIRQDALTTATRVYLNTNTMEYLIKNTGIKALMSEGMKARYLTDGVIPNLMGLDWIANDEMYHTDADVATMYIPDNYIVMLATQVDGRSPFVLYEGPSADDSAPTGTTGKFAKTWKEEDPSARQILVERTWFPGILYPDTVVYAKVV